MLSPKRTKFRKYQKGDIKKIKPNTTKLNFGLYGLKSLESCIITAKTIEAVRRSITRNFKRNGKIWVTVFPDVSVTQKPLEVRMGKGKGAPSYWVCRIQAGQVLFEMDGIPLQLAQQAVKLADNRLHIKTQLVTRM